MSVRRIGLVGLLSVALVALSVAAFYPGLFNSFNYDDGANIEKNEKFRGLSAEHLRWMFTTFHLGHYQPLSWVTLAIDYKIWGLKPFGFLLTNLVMHCVNVLLVFALAVQVMRLARASELTGSTGPRPGATNATLIAAALAAALWGLHPFRVESVSWVTERRDVQSSLFLLLTTLCYIRAAQPSRTTAAAQRADEPGMAAGRPASGNGEAPAARAEDSTISSSRFQPFWYALTLTLYLLSLLSRAMGITWPVVLLLLDWYPLRRLGGPCGWWNSRTYHVWLEKLPFWLLAGGFMVTAPLAQVEAEAAMDLTQHGVLQRIAQAMYGLWFYLYQTLVPIGFVPLYEIREPLPIFTLRYLGPAAFFAATLLALLLFWRRYPWVAVVVVLYGVILSPVLGFFQSGRQEVADRYSYLPMIGWMILIGAGMRRWLELDPLRGRLAAGAGLAVVLVLVVITNQQTRVWKDPFTLWKHAATWSPTATPQQNLAVAYAAQGRLELAIDLFRSALRQEPKFEMALRGLAQALVETKRWEEAADVFKTIVGYGTKDVEIYMKYADVLREQGRESEVEAAYRVVRHLKPDYPRELLGSGIQWLETPNLEKALRDFDDAIRLDPQLLDARVNRGITLSRMGRTDDAIQEYRAVLALDARNAAAHANLGVLFEKIGRRREALEAYQAAVAANPALAEARTQLGNMLTDAGQAQAALQHFDAVLAQDAGHIIARYNRARAYSQLKRTNEAIADLRDVLARRPDFEQARNALAALTRPSTAPASMPAPRPSAAPRP